MCMNEYVTDLTPHGIVCRRDFPRDKHKSILDYAGAWEGYFMDGMCRPYNTQYSSILERYEVHKRSVLVLYVWTEVHHPSFTF